MTLTPLLPFGGTGNIMNTQDMECGNIVTCLVGVKKI